MIITLTGVNDVLRQDALHQITRDFIGQYTDMAIERIDGEETGYARIHEAVQSLPFLVPRKLVILRAPGTNKEFLEHFEQLIADVPETNDVILVETKLDKRLAYYKQLKKLTDFREFGQLDSAALAQYLAKYAASQHGSVSASDARYLIDRVGTDQLLLQHEIDKLLAYDTKIVKANIDLLTERTPQSSVFELLDAAFSGDTRRAMQLYNEQRDMRVEPQQIIAMLVWQLHILAIVKTAGGNSPDSIAKTARISPFTVRKSIGLANHITIGRLKKLVHDLRVFDVRLKSEGLNADEVTRFYLMCLSREGNAHPSI